MAEDFFCILLGLGLLLGPIAGLDIPQLWGNSP